jgi:type IV secretion system protein VirB11
MGTEVTEDTPNVEGHLITDGSRFQGNGPPICLPFFAIRKHASAVFPIQSYVDKGQMTVRQKALITTAIERRLNILVVGGTGAGKTTLVNTLLQLIVQIHPHHRIFGAEETVELKCEAPDQTFMRTSRNIAIADLIKIGMRSFPDRIIIGEARRGKEMIEILTAWGTGHEGGLATIHSNTANPEDALQRVEDMLLQVVSSPMHRMIARTVNMIICIARIEGVRRVTQVVSVLGHYGHAYQLQSET